MGVHRGNTVQVSADLSLWLESPMFWASWHQSISAYSQPSFASSTWKIGGVWMPTRCDISRTVEDSANRKSYMPRRLAQQRMTLSDLEWSCHAWRAISVVAELLVAVFVL